MPITWLTYFDFDLPEEDVLSIEGEKLGWWTMYFDGAVNVCGNGTGAVITLLSMRPVFLV